MQHDSMHFILFCRVIDRFGDAAIAWRLARQLVAAGQCCTLLIDHLPTLKQLCPELDMLHLDLDGIRVIVWSKDVRPSDLPVADVWIECFGCGWGGLDHSHYTDPQRPLRYNLEYLGTESWVEQCHGLDSPDPRTGLKTTFWIPGFSRYSGGLLREQGQDEDDAPSDLLSRLLGMPVHASACSVSLFCYQHAPLQGLADALVEQSEHQETHLLIFPGEPSKAWSQISLSMTSPLHIHWLPWLSHTDYDRLLRCCSLNIVRGEDSFVRAHWAGRPLLWHAYPQDDVAHLDKVRGWLEQRPVSQPFYAWHLDFNQGSGHPDQARAALDVLPEEQACILEFRRTLRGLPSLVEQMLEHIQHQRSSGQSNAMLNA